MLFLAKFAESNAVLVSASTSDLALEALRVAGALDDGLPSSLHEVPDGVFSAEVKWADDESDDEEHAAANVSPCGVILDPFDPLVAWLELEEQTATVLEAQAAGTDALAATQPAPTTEGETDG